MFLEVDNVGYAYTNGEVLFSRLSHRFAPGHSYAVTGPSGTGKSTLLALCAGWLEPTEGSVVREGITRTSWVLQQAFGAPRRSAIDHVAYPILCANADRITALRRASEILSEFALEHLADRPLRQLSGGEAQRLMLARATAMAPDLLLIDEPTAQLDRDTAHTVNNVIAKAATKKTIVLVASHDPETVKQCDFRIDLATLKNERPGR